jgi:hypothetical protein
MASAAPHLRILIFISIGNILASAFCLLGCADFLRRRHRFERGAACGRALESLAHFKRVGSAATSAVAFQLQMLQRR